MELAEPGATARRAGQSLPPRRARSCEIARSGRPGGDGPQAELTIDSRHGLGIEAWQAASRIARRRGHDHEQGAARPQQLRDAGGHLRRVAHCGRQQRSPWKMDRDSVRVLAEPGRQALEGRDHEASVRQASPGRRRCRLSRGPHHRVAARIDAEHELSRMSRCARQNRASVAGAQVHRHRRVGAGGFGQLTDVDLAETMTDLQLHRQMIILA